MNNTDELSESSELVNSSQSLYFSSKTTLNKSSAYQALGIAEAFTNDDSFTISTWIKPERKDVSEYSAHPYGNNHGLRHPIIDSYRYGLQFRDSEGQENPFLHFF